MQRRQFLSTSLTAGAGLSAFGFLSAPSQGQATPLARAPEGPVTLSTLSSGLRPRSTKQCS